MKKRTKKIKADFKTIKNTTVTQATDKKNLPFRLRTAFYL